MKALESLIPSHMAEAIGTTLMHACWQLAALALVLMFLLLFVPRRASRARYYLGVGTLTLMLALPALTFVTGYNPPAPEAAVAPGPVFTAFETGAPVNFTPTISTEYSTDFLTTVSNFFEQNAYLFMGFWVLGAVFFLARFAGGYWRVQRLRRQGTSPVSDELRARFQQLADRIGIRRHVAILQSTQIDTPMVIGALKPVVLLPMGILSGLSMEQVECILVHELAHVRRWDYLVNIFQTLAEILLFFHPAMWWVSRMVRDERENCCDEWVIRLQHNKVQYARALLGLETMRMRQPNLAMASNGGALGRRIRRITGGDSREPRTYSRGFIFVVISMFCFFVLSIQVRESAKASVPFVNLEGPEAGFLDVDQHTGTDVVEAPQPSTPAPKTGTARETCPAVQPLCAKTCSPCPTENSTWSNWIERLPVRFSGLLGAGTFRPYLNLAYIAQDSPVTKVILNDNGQEVVLSFGKNGAVTSATRGGKEVSKEELERYQGMADRFFQGADPMDPMDPMHPMPPMPPMPHIGHIPPLPNVPPIAKMPPMPAMPPLGNLDPESEEYQAKMEEYGRKMEVWGEEFGKQFENADWQKFERDMEQWGEEFANNFHAGSELQQYHEDIARLHKDLENENDPARRRELEEELESMHEQVAEMEAHQREAGWEAYEDRWEEYGRAMEEWGERHAEAMEHMGEEMEREAERMHRDAEHMANKYTDAAEYIGEELVSDGLIEDQRSYKIKLNEDELYVNGSKQAASVHRKYLGIVEELMGVHANGDWITITQKKGKNTITH